MYGVIAAASATNQANPLAALIPFIPILIIFYFLLIRPQQKKQKEFQKMLGQLKKNDKVVTVGGIHGVILGVKEHAITVKIADNVKVEMDKSGVARVVGTDSEEGGK